MQSEVDSFNERTRLPVTHNAFFLTAEEMQRMNVTEQDVQTGLSALKFAIDSIKTLLGIYRDAKDLLPGPQQEAATAAVAEAEKQLAIAEAQIAKTLGYQICHCSFPPTIMLKIGVDRQGDPVFGCTECGTDSAYPKGVTRLEKMTRSE
jgi:hypothetical protein